MDASMIFTPGTVPSITYNSRVSTDIEKKVKDWVFFGGQILVINGKSKVGKTVLVERSISNSNLILVDSNRLESGESIFKVIAEAISLPEEVTKETINVRTNVESSIKGSFESKISLWTFLSTKLKASSNLSGNVDDSVLTEKTYQSSIRDMVIDYCIEEKLIIAIDDFHYITTENQIKIIRDLKDAIFKGMRVTTIIIPNRQEDIINNERDYNGRVELLDIPEWTKEELKFIPQKGFEELNYKVDDSVMDLLSDVSFKSPLLMQQHCANICKHFSIYEKASSLEDLNLDLPNLDIILKASSVKREILKRLIKGKTSTGKKRMKKSLRGYDREVDMYQLIILSLSQLKTVDNIPLVNLITKIEELVDEKENVRKSDITYTLNKISDIAEADDKLEPVIKYNSELEEIIINDSYFAFSMYCDTEELIFSAD